MIGLHGPNPLTADVQVFSQNSQASDVGWAVWLKPPGATMCYLFVVGQGGNGGKGFVGATGGGGGGGGSGGQTSVLMPALFLPDVLYVSVGGATSRIAIAPNNVTQSNCVAYANSGGGGANGTSGGAGGNGVAGAIATVANSPLSATGASLFLAGQAGTNGGVTSASPPAAHSLPVTGLLVAGGSGGGGLNASGAGNDGGSFTVAGAFPTNIGGAAGATATTPPGDGSSGVEFVINGLRYGYGGAGGGSSFVSATGAGLSGGNGGSGAPGCGGGGGGAAFTGSTQGQGGAGGPSRIIIISW